MGRDNKGRGHGGRGRGRGKSSGRRDTNTKPAEMKFLPHTTGANKLIATYETVKTHIEQYVQKTYKHGQDIAESLRELRRKDLSGVMPVRQMSTYVEASDERLRKIEQEGTTYSTPQRSRITWTGKIPWKPTSEEHMRLY